MINKILFLFLIIVGVNASNCDMKLFSYVNSMNEKERLSIKEFLDLIVTQKCGINITYKDYISKEIVKNKMPYVNIKNYTLKEILELVLTQKGLFYNLNNNILSISYYKTKTYKINFISSSRSGSSNLDATNSKVKNKYNFDFWSKIKDQIYDLLKSNYYLDPYYTILGKQSFISETESKAFLNANIQKNKTNEKGNFKGKGNKGGQVKKSFLSLSASIYPPIVDKESGIIIVTGTMKQLKAVDKYINNLMNSLTKQVLIDVHIYSVELSKSHKTGIDWTNLSITLNKTNVPLRARYLGGSQSVFNAATFNMSAFLNFLAQNGNVNSISNPKIITLNNQKAIISVGDTIYYKYASSVVTDQNGNPQTQYTISSKFVGVVLDITPQISDNGEIILSIEPRLSKFRDITQLTATNRGMPPDTTDNTMLSIVKIKNNQTLVLGGLITNDESLKVNGVPVLKEIPIIKYLFSSKESVTTKKELVFVITPHIIDFKHKKTLRDLGFGKF